MAAVPGQLVEPFRPTGIALKPLQNHWNSLRFLQTPRGGTPYRSPRIRRSPGNLTVSWNRWESLRFPYDSVSRMEGTVAELNVASDNSASGMHTGTHGFTGKH